MGDTTEEGFKNAYQSWDKLLVNKKWSNYFFVDTMHQKLRGIYMPLKLQELLQQSASEGDQVALDAQLRAVAIIGGYNDAMYDDSNWQKEIEAAIEHNMHALAICEHNRWNVQQLLMGFAPADELKLKEFAQLESNKKTEVARNARDRWRKAVNWNQMTEPLERKRAKEHQLYKQSPYGIYDEKKNELKHGSLHIHPNIIHYDLLDIYDTGAKGYDEKLNDGIPLTLVHVDGYKQEAWFEMKMKAYKIL
jgi:hypothetical protein